MMNVNARFYLSYDTKIALNSLFSHENVKISPFENAMILWKSTHNVMKCI